MALPKFKLRGFKSPSETFLDSLGKLERAVMAEVWRLGEATVRDVWLKFEERIAYTTVMTTLDRLYKKNLLGRTKEGRAFIYAPKLSPEEFERSFAGEVIGSLFDKGSIEPVLACIVDAVSDRDRVMLDELERLVQEKRRALEE